MINCIYTTVGRWSCSSRSVNAFPSTTILNKCYSTLILLSLSRTMRYRLKYPDMGLSIPEEKTPENAPRPRNTCGKIPVGEEALFDSGIRWRGDRGALFQHSEGMQAKSCFPRECRVALWLCQHWAQCYDSMAAYRGSICFYVQINTLKNPLCLFTKGYCTNDHIVEQNIITGAAEVKETLVDSHPTMYLELPLHFVSTHSRAKHFFSND